MIDFRTVLECDDGLACLESAGHPGYYLGLAELDYEVNFYEEEDFPPQHEAYKFKWVLYFA